MLLHRAKGTGRLDNCLQLSRRVRSRNATQTVLKASPTPPPSEPTPHTVISKRLRTRNLLRSVNATIPRSIEDSHSRDLWSTRVNAAVDDLGESRLPTIGVWGPVLHYTRGIVTALLEDPLSSNDQRRKLLENRPGVPSTEASVGGGLLRIRYSTTDALNNDTLEIAAPWLRTAGAEIIESWKLEPEEALTNLLACDIAMIVVPSHLSPKTPSIAKLLDALSNKPNVYILLKKKPDAVYPASDLPSLDAIHITSSAIAREAQTSFRKFQLHEALQPSSSSYRSEQVKHFQTAMIQSGIPTLSTQLLKTLSEQSSTNRDDSPLRLGSALYTARIALRASRDSVEEMSEEINKVRDRVEDLRASSACTLRQLRTETFETGSDVQQSAHEARSQTETYLASVAWWKLPWRMDDLAADISAILRAVYGRKLERQLTYQAGRISTVRDALAEKAEEHITFEPPSSPFNSNLLQNSISQLTSVTHLGPTTLTSPISARLQQIIQTGGPLSYLHFSAQKLLLQSYVLSFGGAVGAWSGWVGAYLTEETAVGVGALGVLAGLRWIAGGWEKAKKRWWERWDRVEAGLERDLHARFEDVVQTRVLAKTTRAREGLQSLVESRQKTVDELSAELDALQAELDSLLSVEGR